ncbi:MAG TPA: glycosyltransferase [Solirubrobacteraceae bacterium]|nr:glycosyltransferase [Solirubrobacteraceae bacterium]
MPDELSAVHVGEMDLERFEGVLDAGEFAELHAGVLRARTVFAGRTIWNVSSTARGGGVAEMLTTLLAYARGVGVDARWQVIAGDAEFFAITKRIHNRLHGFAGDGGPLGEAEREHYEATLRRNGEQLTGMLGEQDIVILHDPQTAGLVPAVRARGVPVVWRCHVGIDQPNALVRETWRFLERYVAAADATVFSRNTFVWEGLDPARVSIIMPSLDAFAPKNQELEPAVVASILAAAAIRLGDSPAAPAYTGMDGTAGLVRRCASMTEERPLNPAEEYVAQVSRWDALKDPLGVLASFAEYISPYSDAHLVYAGPEVDGVCDDPEGAQTLASVRDRWASLPFALRERIHLAELPMSDAQENAAIVNALQRGARVVVQKSLAEGFGLTVAEAMWKARPVVASRIGGIQDQIEDGRSGLLLECPADLAPFGAAVRSLLDDRARAEAMGAAARERVREHFLGPRSLLAYLGLLGRLLQRPPT